MTINSNEKWVEITINFDTYDQAHEFMDWAHPRTEYIDFKLVDYQQGQVVIYMKREKILELQEIAHLVTHHYYDGYNSVTKQ